MRTVFAQCHREAADQQLGEVVTAMGARWPRAAQVLQEAADDALAYAVFPHERWRQIYFTNQLERPDPEIKRETEAVRIFADGNSIVRLVDSILS